MVDKTYICEEWPTNQGSIVQVEPKGEHLQCEVGEDEIEAEEEEEVEEADRHQRLLELQLHLLQEMKTKLVENSSHFQKPVNSSSTEIENVSHEMNLKF